jgi:hypothetical protein
MMEMDTNGGLNTSLLN